MPSQSLRVALEPIDSVVIAEFDHQGLLLRGNAGLRRLAGAQPVSLWQLLSRPDVSELLASTTRGCIYNGLLSINGAGDSMVTLTGSLHRSADRLCLWAGFDMNEFETLSTSLLALNDEVNVAYRALANSKHALELREADILKLSLTDALTGVGNRRMLNEALLKEVERAARYGDPLSLLILDIDHFKRVNDTWGHESGDRVLKETGATLLRLLRPSDTATRMGGEEFVVLLPATALDDAVCCAERFRGVMAAFDFGLGSAVTSSFGVSCLQCDETGAALLARADGALYQAKQQGRNRVVAATASAASAADATSPVQPAAPAAPPAVRPDPAVASCGTEP